jgi:hypothetical protein
MVSKMKKLIRETDWLRIYSTDIGQHFESKLLPANASLAYGAVIKNWNAITPEEQWEIALALQLQGSLEAVFIPLIDFLLDNGGSVVCSTIAPLLPMHPNKERVLSFLISQISQEKSHRANYFQALALIGDLRSVAPLEEAYDEIERKGIGGSISTEQASDFIACCEALWKLTGEERFRSSILRLVDNPNHAVSSMARLALTSL